LTIAKVRLSNAVRYSLIAGVLSSLFVGALLIGPVKVILGYVAAYGRNPSMALISLLIILLIIVPPLLSICRMLISRDPYKKVEKKIAITGIVCVLFIILIWIIYLSWSRASGYNFSF